MGKILMRNTVFKPLVFIVISLCVCLTLGVVFYGITASVHAITASEVQTEADLKQFVEEAIDAYYYEFILKERCDLSQLVFPEEVEELFPLFLKSYGIEDLSPDSIRMLTVAEMKKITSLFNNAGVKNSLSVGFIWTACDLPPPSSFREVLESEEGGKWRSGSIYLFVTQHMEEDPRQTFIFHGQDMQFENKDVTGLQDAYGRRVMDLAEQAANEPVQGRTEKGFFHYCWDDPTIEHDNIEDMNPLTAPGDSWKISYVVDPFDYLGLDALPDSPRVIFGSGIYPKTGTPPSGCDGDGMADVSGGGCAIAAGSDNTPLSTVFNLLLIVFALGALLKVGHLLRQST